jgi:hypothetical protein
MQNGRINASVHGDAVAPPLPPSASNMPQMFLWLFPWDPQAVVDLTEDEDE